MQSDQLFSNNLQPNLTLAEAQQIINAQTNLLNQQRGQLNQVAQGLGQLRLAGNFVPTQAAAQVSPEVQNQLERIRANQAFLNSDFFTVSTNNGANIANLIGKSRGIGSTGISSATLDSFNTLATANPVQCTTTQSHVLTQPSDRFLVTDYTLTTLGNFIMYLNLRQTHTESRMGCRMLFVGYCNELPKRIM